MRSLTINKKKYPFHLGVRAWKEYALELQGNGSELKLDSLDDIYITYLGLKYGAIAQDKELVKAGKKGKGFTLTAEDVEELLDTDIGAYFRAVKVITNLLPKEETKKEVRPEA